jgi:hypothetical protein
MRVPFENQLITEALSVTGKETNYNHPKQKERPKSLFCLESSKENYFSSTLTTSRLSQIGE